MRSSCIAHCEIQPAVRYIKPTSGVDMWVRVRQSGQAIKLFQAPRKISFTFNYFWHNSFILDRVKLAELSNNSFE